MLTTGLVLAIGAGTIVGTLLWFANSRLRAYQGTIS
jgi:hypothetical protein